MKNFKIASIAILSVLAVLYLAFLLILPNVININNYAKELDKLLQDSCGFRISMKSMKLYTKWNLAVGVNLTQLDLKYPTGEKFAQVDDLKLGISLPHLILRKIKLDSLELEELVLRLKVKKDGTFLIEDFLAQMQSQEKTEQTAFEMPFGLTFSQKMPNIILKKYSISLVDMVTNKFYTLKGSNFEIKDFELSKKIRINTNGSLLFDNREQVKFDIKFLSKVFPEIELEQKENTQTQRVNIIDILKKLYDLNVTANITSDLTLSGDMNDIKTDGTLDINNLALTVKNKRLPESNIDLKLAGNKIKINSNLYTAKNNVLNLDGFFKYGKKPFTDLNVKTSETNLSDLVLILSTVLNLVGNTDLQQVSADGIINADFRVKSNLKKIESNGYLKINNANIYYNLYNIALKNIISDIDFSGNKVNIKKATANLNNAPISIKGYVTSNAVADVSVLADKLPLKGILATLGQNQLLKENDIYSGLITAKLDIKGKLDKVTPNVYVIIENIKLRNKPNKATLNLANSKVQLKTDGKIIKGGLNINDLSVLIPNMPSVRVPDTSFVFDEKNLKINKAYLLLNNSKIDCTGAMSNYNSKQANLDITARGLIHASDIKLFLPREYRKDIVAQGKLPLIIKITGNDKVQDVKAQMLANQNNFISIIDINSLKGKTALINVSMKLANNTLKIFDISLNELKINKGLSNNFNSNLSNASKIATIKGAITDLNAKNQTLQNISINIPQELNFAVPALKNSSIHTKANLTLNGKTNNPQILGQINTPYIAIPSYKTTIKNTTTTLNPSTINVNCNSLLLDNSKLSFNSVISNNFSKGVNIKSVDLNGDNFDLDSFITILANLPQNANAPGTDLGITLSNGKGKLNRFKMGNIQTTNINTDFTINNNTLKLYNLTTDAYLGKVAGTITYNLLYNKLGINLQGRNMNANTSVTALTGIKNPLNGTLDFDATNLTMRGSTEQQLIQSLTGNTGFIISNGQMGSLGKLENLLYAQNIANSILKTSLGAITKAVSIKKTGDFKYIKGKMNFANGWCNIQSIQTSGPAMSMYVNGRYNILTNHANLIILGRLSNDVVQVLGPIGEFSVNKLISSIPKIGQITSSVINQLTTSPEGENLSMLPPLTPNATVTKEFKASINGLVDSTKSVSYFKWLSTPTVGNSDVNSSPLQNIKGNIRTEAQNAVIKYIPKLPAASTTPTRKNPTGVADFINSLPELKR